MSLKPYGIGMEQNNACFKIGRIVWFKCNSIKSSLNALNITWLSPLRRLEKTFKKTMVLCFKILAIVGLRNPDQKDPKKVK